MQPRLSSATFILSMALLLFASSQSQAHDHVDAHLEPDCVACSFSSHDLQQPSDSGQITAIWQAERSTQLVAAPIADSSPTKAFSSRAPPRS